MKTTPGSFAAIALVTALLGSTPGTATRAGDEAQWQAAVDRIKQALQNKDRDPETMAKAILDLGDATYEIADKRTATFLLDILLTELKDDSLDGKREERIDGRILEACEASLKRVRSKAAVDYLVGQVRNSNLNFRARFIMARTLGAHPGEPIKALLELTEAGRDMRLQIGAVDGLAIHVRETVGTKVEAADSLAMEAATQAETLKEAAGKCLEERTAGLANIECDGIAFQLDLLVAGKVTRDPSSAAIERLKAIAASIEKPETRRLIEPFVGALEGTVTKVYAAVDAISEARTLAAPVLARLLKLAGDPKRSWEVRVGAVAALRPDRNHSHAEPLIEALGNCAPEDGRLKVDIMSLLGAILRVKNPKSDSPDFWKGALADRNEGRPPGESGGTTVMPTEFFGLKTKSTRIVFVLDRTGSMEFPCTEPDPKKEGPPPRGPDTATGGDQKPAPGEEAARKAAGDIKKKYDDRKVEKRIDMLKKEFINTIHSLDPRVSFAVVYYEATPTNWKPALVQATWAAKLECIQEIDRINPNGGTNIWDALVNAFQFVAEPQRPDVVEYRKGNYAHHVNGADTLFLMSDGNHNKGQFAEGRDFDHKAFFAEFRKINSIRKVVVNTIILGDTAHDNPDPIKPKSLWLFRKIAEDSGGTFVHLGM